MTSANEVNPRVIAAIVIGSMGLVLMMFGSVYYLTRLGDVSSQRSIAAEPAVLDDDEENQIPDKEEEEQQAGEEPAFSEPVIDTNVTAANPQTATSEQLIEIYAPAGKLGFILDDSNEEDKGPPTVHQVRSTSILINDIRVGDKLIALDDEDVRQMSSNNVSKLIARKIDNTTRKLSILRLLPNIPNV